jgi:hypothetical protein
MRRFALGGLLYDPERFGKMLTGDFLDAMAGFNEAENERAKSLAPFIRTATWFLWNIQVLPEDKKDSPEGLWKFPWEKIEKADGIIISDEDRKKVEDFQADTLSRM